MNGTSRNPFVVTKATSTPFLSSKAFVAIVVPRRSAWIGTSTGHFSTPVAMPCKGSAGVVSVFHAWTDPDVLSKATKSVKVPPTSTPRTQLIAPQSVIHPFLAARWRVGGKSECDLKTIHCQHIVYEISHIAFDPLTLGPTHAQDDWSPGFLKRRHQCRLTQTARPTRSR